MANARRIERHPPWAPPLLVLALLVGAVGCAGEGTTTGGDGGDGGGADFASVQREVFDLHCTSASCHASSSRQGNLILEAAVSYDQLVNVQADNPVARAAGLVRVAPSEPDQSFLVRKLTGDLAPGEGSPMPLGMAQLSDADIALVRAWIAAGALREPTPAQ